MADNSPQALAKKLLAILHKDHERLEHIDNYVHGRHEDPYMPENCTAEYRLLARRCVSNWMPLLVSTPAQALYVDAFRRGSSKTTPADSKGAASDDLASPEWKHWQRSRLDSRQIAVHRGALIFGHSFTLTEKVKGKVLTKGLSPKLTAALYEDPANDDTPYAALTITKRQSGDAWGSARMWDGKNEYAVSYKGSGEDAEVRVANGKKHGASECPITRFAASVDLEGRTVGVVEPMIALQNRINQTVFDLLIAQTYASVKVRYVAGMAPPLQRDEEGNLILDASGNPKPVPMNHNASRFLFAEDNDAKFGSLDESPLGGFIESIDMSVRHLSAVSQTPPHYLLGQIANLSAEALQAAEIALQRKVQEFQNAFGECWERVFRLAAELSGNAASADDFEGEVIWRDMEQRSLAQSADALGKLGDQLGIPKKGLWTRVPGVTAGELSHWETLAEEDPQAQLAGALNRATGGSSTGNLGQGQPNSFGNRTPNTSTPPSPVTAATG